MKKFLSFLLIFAALSVSGSAAFYSVFGLGKLFAGASVQVMIMAGSLEFAKLVIATALHRYWKEMNKLMRGYLTFAVIILICITSAGIYGFLSSAYQTTAAMDGIVTKQINILELKKNRFSEQRDEYIFEKTQIVNSITELRKSISNPNQVQYIDRKTGQLVTTTSSSARKSLEGQLNEAISRRDVLSGKIEAVSDSLATMDIKVVEAQAASEVGNELGPLKYLASLTGKPMNTVVNWFLLLLIFVFDPLAVTLIILANYSFEKAFGKSMASFIETPEPVVPAPEEVTDSKARFIINPDSISDKIEKSIPTELSDRQRRNMTHQEIEKWYRENSL